MNEQDLMPAYSEVLQRWTAETRVYQDLQSRLMVTGTMKTADFRRAYVRQYARDYRLEPVEADKMLADQLAGAKTELEFLLSVFAPSPEEMDLDSKDSPWRVYLERPDGGRMNPFEIRRVKKKTPRLEGYFPYISPWATVYQIRFLPADRVPDRGDLTLVLTGVHGTARLVYHLEDQLF